MATEMVVVVRDSGAGWVAQTADTVRAQGCAVGLVTGPLEPGEEAEFGSHVDRLSVIDDPTDPHRIADAARALADGYRLGAVLSPHDTTLVAAARAAELLGIGRVPADGLLHCRNKHAFRHALRAAGLPGPRFALLADPSGADAVADTVGLPAVVKPVNGAGSHFVEPVHTVSELRAAYQRITERLLDAPQLRNMYRRPLEDPTGEPIDPETTLLVESMLRGHEYTVDFVVRDGDIEMLPLVDKFLVDDRFFELGFVSPPLDLEPAKEKALIACVEDAVRAIGMDNTVGCIEVIDDERAGPTAVEVNGRPAGQLLGTLYTLRTGINTAAEVVALARGVASERDTPQLPIPLATLTIFAEQTGRLRAVRGLEEVAELPDVIRVVQSVQPGDLLTDDYEIFAINLLVAGFTDYADLEEIYQEVSQLVSFEIDPC